MRGWTGLSSFGSPVWLALSIVFGFGTAGERAAAQSTTADILGTVTDTTGAIMPGAKVMVTALATGEKREATANAAGEFVFNNLNPGHYKVEVTASGFKTFVVPDLLAAAGDRARVDAKLTAGAVNETVVVGSMTPLLQTDSNSSRRTMPTWIFRCLRTSGHFTIKHMYSSAPSASIWPTIPRWAIPI